jgi:hypothetical protein
VALGQNMVQYGAAAATGVSAGTAAGKKASDALTNLMGQAAGATQADKDKEAQEKSAQEKAAKEKAAKASKPEPGQDKQASSGPSGAASMPSGPGPNQGPSGGSGAPAKGGGPRAAKTESVSQARESAFPGKAETESAPRGKAAAEKTTQDKPTQDRQTMLASTRPILNPATAMPRSKAKAALVTQQLVQAVEPEPDPVAEMPITMKAALAAFHPALQPISERMQRLRPGATRDDVKRILGSPASKVTIPGDTDINEIYYYMERGRTVGTVRLEAGVVTRVNTDGI